MTLGLRYDAQAEPDKRWLEFDESQRQDAIRRYHERCGAEHPDLPNPTLHAVIHLVLENQLAMEEPHEVRPALKRLVSRGLARHEALHQLGIPLAHYLFEVMQGEGSADDSMRKYQLALREV